MLGGKKKNYTRYSYTENECFLEGATKKKRKKKIITATR